MRLRIFAIAAVAATLAGCTTGPKNAMREPALSPVGSGLYEYPPIPVQDAFPASAPKTRHSLWSDNRADFFQDPRALGVGDIITVVIDISDEAKLDNRSSRDRQSRIGGGLDVEGAFGKFALPVVGAEIGATNSSSVDGEGRIDRSEDIQLSVAAVVGQKLPNGNLFISGQQEIRVNYEVRVLAIAGIIRPRDIGRNNTIGYDKIAEARISYGGRGRVSDIQQPGWGQQVYDAVAPY